MRFPGAVAWLSLLSSYSLRTSEARLLRRSLQVEDGALDSEFDRVEDLNVAYAECDAENGATGPVTWTEVQFFYAIHATAALDQIKEQAIEDMTFNLIQTAVLWCTLPQQTGIDVGNQGRKFRELLRSHEFKEFQRQHRKLSVEQSRRLSIIAFNNNPIDENIDNLFDFDTSPCQFSKQLVCGMMKGSMGITAHASDNLALIVASILDAIQEVMYYDMLLEPLCADEEPCVVTKVEFWGTTVEEVTTNVDKILNPTDDDRGEDGGDGDGIIVNPGGDDDDDNDDIDGDGKPDNPGGDNDDLDGDGKPDNPGGDNDDLDGDGKPDNPGGDNDDLDGDGKPDNPGGDDDDLDGDGKPDDPGGDNDDLNGDGKPDNPGGDNDDLDGDGKPDNPGGDNDDLDGDGKPDNPGGDNDDLDGDDKPDNGDGKPDNPGGDNDDLDGDGKPDNPGGNNDDLDGDGKPDNPGGDDDDDDDDDDLDGDGKPDNPGGDDDDDDDDDDLDGDGKPDITRPTTSPSPTLSPTRSAAPSISSSPTASMLPTADQNVDGVDGKPNVDDDDDDDGDKPLLLFAALPVVFLAALMLLLARNRNRQTATARQLEEHDDYILPGTSDPPRSFHEGMYHYTRSGARYLSTNCKECHETRMLGMSMGSTDLQPISESRMHDGTRSYSYDDVSLESDEQSVQDPSGHRKLFHVQAEENNLAQRASTVDVHKCTSATCPICNYRPKDVCFISSPESPRVKCSPRRADTTMSYLPAVYSTEDSSHHFRMFGTSDSNESI